MTRIFGISVSDPLGILTRIGGDTAGAISFETPEAITQWSYEPIADYYGTNSVEDALEPHFSELDKRPFLAETDGIRLSSARGQKKTDLAVLTSHGIPKIGLPEQNEILAIPKHGAPSTIIVKPDNKNLPYIFENEAYCLNLAKLCGINTTETGILPVNNRSALVSVRYDRSITNSGSIKRLHQEDFAQANGVFPIQKYELGNPGGLTMQDILGTGKYISGEHILSLRDQVIFNILVASTDAHAKNYSLLLADDFQMAPLYDVSSVLCWPHVNQYHAQKLAGKKRKPQNMVIRNWDQIASSSGFHTRVFRERVQQLADQIFRHRPEAVRSVSDAKGIHLQVVEHIADTVEQNALRIAGRLSIKPQISSSDRDISP